MKIEETRKNWTALGENDPMWAVLTDPDKKGNRWTAEEFFATGERDVEEIFARLQTAGITPLTGRVLDFGCGLGRLSQALAKRFNFVDGVDISPSMIRQAVEFNQFPNRVEYHVNPCENLAAFPADKYDFVCTMIVLLHIPPKFQQNYIRDFLRILKPGGIAYFHTVHAHGWRQFVPNRFADLIRRWRSRGQPFISIYGIPVERVCETIRSSSGTVVKYESTNYGGWESRYGNDTFIVKK